MTNKQQNLDEVIAIHHADNKWSVRKADLERMLENAKRQEALFFGKKFVTVYQLENGFTVDVSSAVINPAKFDLEIGRQLNYQHALNKLWELEGYKIQQAKYEAEGSNTVEEIELQTYC